MEQRSRLDREEEALLDEVDRLDDVVGLEVEDVDLVQDLERLALALQVEHAAVELLLHVVLLS
jgi:hypothetical protein